MTDEEISPIETIEYWAYAYADPASGEHFMGHGMVPVLLREYAALRRRNSAIAEKAQADERDAIIALASAKGWAMRNEDAFDDAVREICDERAAIRKRWEP